MKIDGYSILCEFFDKRKDEKVIKSFPIMNLSIYKGDELVTKRYLIARLSITNRKLVIDRLSKIVPLPIFLDRESIVHSFAKILWKPVRAFDIPYIYFKNMEYDKKTKTLRIETLKERVTLFMKFTNTEKVSKEIEKIIRSFVNR